MLPMSWVFNADYVNQYVMHMTDRRLQELGFDPEYNVPNPAKMDGYSQRYSRACKFL